MISIFIVTYMGMHKVAISTQNPKANGQAERANSDIIKTIRALSLQYPLSWPDLLPSVRFNHMSNVSNSSKFSPFELLYGVPPRFPQGYLWTDPQAIPATTQQAMERLLPELASFRQAAHENLQKAAEVHKQAYDDRRKTGEVLLYRQIF